MDKLPLIDLVDGHLTYMPPSGDTSGLVRLLGEKARERQTLDVTHACRLTNHAHYSEKARVYLRDHGLPSWFGLALYPYQVEGAFALASGHPYVADEPGLGKTRQTLAAVSLADPPRLMIVCPPVAVTSWAKEVSASRVCDPSRRDNTHVVSDVSDIPVGEHVTVYYPSRKTSISDKTRVVVVSDSTLVARPQLQQEICDWNPRALIIDEAHRYKNGSAQRTRVMKKLARSVRGIVVAASGTPIVASPLELASQMMIVGRFTNVFGGYESFLRRFFTTMPWGEHIPKKKKMKELRVLLDTYVWIRRKKADVLTSLPEKIRHYSVVDVDLKDYRATHKDVIAEIASFCELNEKELAAMKPSDRDRALWEFSKASFVLVSRLRQAAGRAKIASALAFIDEHCSAHRPRHGAYDSPLIVWTHHRDVASTLADHVHSLNVPYRLLTGETSQSERGRITHAFQDGEVGVLIASMSAAGVGITLTRSSTALFVETDWTPALLVQAEDRIHRIGQRLPPTYTTLIAPGTLDEAIIRVLQRKNRVLEAVVGGDSAVNMDLESNSSATVLHEMVKDYVSHRYGW